MGGVPAALWQKGQQKGLLLLPSLCCRVVFSSGCPTPWEGMCRAPGEDVPAAAWVTAVVGDGLHVQMQEPTDSSAPAL